MDTIDVAVGTHASAPRSDMEQPLTLPLDDEHVSFELAGGKGANLARLARADLPVPDGFILTTHAYSAFIAANNLEQPILDLVARTAPDDPQALEAASTEIRARFSAGTMPTEIAEALREAYAAIGSPAVAVRSSATAEDLPELSFAGQQDTFLNVVGVEALLRAVVDCWSSLWTARAIGYRSRNGIEQRGIALAVVVQAMVQSEAAGVLFTANPLTGKRGEVVIDATLGLGEALVAGQVEPDHYVVDPGGGRVLETTLGAKALAIRGQTGGGTTTVAEDAAERQALPDAAIVALARIGQRIEQLFGSPQDIEWAWADGRLFVLQSRAITSLFPLPEGIAPHPLQVLLSFGAVQGVLDPLTPLGRDLFRQFFAAVANQFNQQVTRDTQRIFLVAGERVFLNITGALRHPRLHFVIPGALTVAEPAAGQALATVLGEPALATSARPMSLRTRLHTARMLRRFVGNIGYNLLYPNLGRLRIQRLIEQTVGSIQARSAAASTLSQRIALFDEVPGLLVQAALPYLLPGVISGMICFQILNRLAASLPGGRQLVLEITRGLPHNVTTEMDLALWQTACAIKADPAGAAYLQQTDAATLADEVLSQRLPAPTQRAIDTFLERYGMRGIAEIDIGRARWREQPLPLIQSLQSYLQIDDPNAAPDAIFSRGAAAAQTAIMRLTQALAQTPRGWLKVRVARWAARRVRALSGMRESPKFTMIRCLGILRAALLDTGHELVARGVLSRPDDLFFLHPDEIRALASGTDRDWQALVNERRAAYAREKRRRQVPRLLLSDGRAFFDGVAAPADTDGATLVGSPVSPGVVEGIVHVVLDPRGTQLAPGEILVCPGTDPAWTPLFLAAGGLVMEVGGLMTHGSVVAREYGIPAVVGVHQATTRLRSGQRIRVDGSQGHIILLDEA
ncbi:MAG TPA: PEP/pyruvate-binding domain-containing protein [Herpetosiphonaceae bacterium]